MSRTKREIQLYQVAALQIILDAQGRETDDGDNYGYRVMTTVGPLLIDIGDDCCVCTRFQNLHDAKQMGLGERLNPYSGKWNWMGGNDHAGDIADLFEFGRALDALQFYS